MSGKNPVSIDRTLKRQNVADLDFRVNCHDGEGTTCSKAQAECA